MENTNKPRIEFIAKDLVLRGFSFSVSYSPDASTTVILPGELIKKELLLSLLGMSKDKIDGLFTLPEEKVALQKITAIFLGNLY